MTHDHRTGATLALIQNSLGVAFEQIETQLEALAAATGNLVNADAVSMLRFDQAVRVTQVSSQWRASDDVPPLDGHIYAASTFPHAFARLAKGEPVFVPLSDGVLVDRDLTIARAGLNREGSLWLPAHIDGRSFGVMAVRWSGRPSEWTEHEYLTLTVIAQVVGTLFLRLETKAQRRTTDAQLRHYHRRETVALLAGGIAHDFNNLLMVVQANCELAINRMHSVVLPARLGIQRAIQATQKAGELTRQLLALGKGAAMTEQVVDLHRSLDTVVALVSSLLPPDIGLQTDFKAANPFVLVSVAELEQVILNLCINARDAMPRGGELTLRTENTALNGKPSIRLLVIDQGEGIKPEDLGRVTEPFFSTKPEGQGLGLSIVHQIAHEREWNLSFASVVDRGTEVSVVITNSHNLPEVVWDQAPARDMDPGDVARSILVVDDEVPLLKLMCRILERGGFRVLPATSGREALKLFDERPEGVLGLVTDAGMPGMSGIELAGRLLERRPKLPVMVVTGRAVDADSVLFLADPSRELVMKPFSGARLVERLRQLVDLAETDGDSPA